MNQSPALSTHLPQAPLLAGLWSVGMAAARGCIGDVVGALRDEESPGSGGLGVCVAAFAVVADKAVTGGRNVKR